MIDDCDIHTYSAIIIHQFPFPSFINHQSSIPLSLIHQSSLIIHQFPFPSFINHQFPFPSFINHHSSIPLSLIHQFPSLFCVAVAARFHRRKRPRFSAQLAGDEVGSRRDDDADCKEQ